MDDEWAPAPFKGPLQYRENPSSQALFGELGRWLCRPACRAWMGNLYEIHDMDVNLRIGDEHAGCYNDH